MWGLTGKIEDRTEPLDEAFFDKFKKNKNPDITIQLIKGYIQNILSSNDWLCSGYNNNRIKSTKDLTEDKIAGFVQHTITQKIINYYIDNKKPLPKTIYACAFTAKDIERAINTKPGTYTNSFTFFIFFRPDPILTKDEMNEFWKHSDYSIYPISALFGTTNENVILAQTFVPIVPYDELDEATKLTKDQKKEIVKDALRAGAKGALFGPMAANIEDNIDNYVKYGSHKKMAEAEIRSAMKTKGKLKEINIKYIEKHFNRLRSTTLRKADGYDKRLKELEDYYKSLNENTIANLDESFLDKMLKKSMDNTLTKHNQKYPELTPEQKENYIKCATNILKKEESKLTSNLKEIVNSVASNKFRKAYTIKVDYNDSYCDSRADGGVNFPILYWDLTKAYTNARYQMQEDGCNEFFNEYNDIREKFIDYLDKNYNPRGAVGWAVSEDGDWDEGFIYINIPVSQLSINIDESSKNTVEVKLKAGRNKINLTKGKVEQGLTEKEIISDIVRKSQGKENDSVHIDPLTGKMSMKIGQYEITW